MYVSALNPNGGGNPTDYPVIITIDTGNNQVSHILNYTAGNGNFIQGNNQNGGIAVTSDGSKVYTSTFDPSYQGLTDNIYTLLGFSTSTYAPTYYQTLLDCSICSVGVGRVSVSSSGAYVLTHQPKTTATLYDSDIAAHTYTTIQDNPTDGALAYTNGDFYFGSIGSSFCNTICYNLTIATSSGTQIGDIHYDDSFGTGASEPGVAIISSLNYAYITENYSGADSVAVINLNTNKLLTTINVGSDPRGIAALN